MFAAEAKVDTFRDTPGDQLLTGLRGKDVVLTFVESYGRTAVQGPEFAPRIQPLLDEGTRRLHAAGFGARTGFLTSSTGDAASRDVPITVVARNPAVLERISGWGWTEGLKPDPHAPVWRMDAFRDKFLTAFGPQAQAQAPVPAAR